MSGKAVSRPTWEADVECGVRLDCDAAGDAILCTFGGIWGTGSKPGYEFVKTASRLPVKKVYLTDIDQVWYQNGIRSLGSSVEAAAVEIQSILEAQRARRVVMIGNSAGGYAAILFGVLTGADEVHAISPQTELLRPEYSYFPEKLPGVRNAAGSKQEYLDVRKIFEQWPDSGDWDKTKIYIHYSRLSRKDRYHARRMKGFPNVFLIPYWNPTHGLASLLRDMGILEPLLMNALNGTGDDVHKITADARYILWRSLRQAVQRRMRRSSRRLSRSF